MAHFVAVTEIELARARADPGYRQQLLTTSLEQLLAELNRHKRKGNPGAKLGEQLREGSLLAVKLADLITRIDQQRRA